MKNILFFVIYLVFNPRLTLLLFKGVYIPVYVQFEWLKDFPINTVVDIGAHKGRVTKALNYLFPDAKFYAFEPNKRLYTQLKHKLKSKNFVVEPFAVGNKNGYVNFYEYPDSSLSSTVELDNKASLRYGFNNKSADSEAKALTLDQYFKKIIARKNIFLKIDTQGTDLEVLKGAKDFLKRVSIVHVETLFAKLYKNQKYFSDIYDFMTKNNYYFVGNVSDSVFYPYFNLSGAANSVFINKKYIKDLNFQKHIFFL